MTGRQRGCGYRSRAATTEFARFAGRVRRAIVADAGYRYSRTAVR